MDSDDIMTRDQDARRDAFLCLAVTIPPRQRARIRATMGPLLARARIKGSARGPPEAAPDCRPDQQGQQDQSGGAPRPDQNGNDCDLAAEIEARLGLISTLCVLGCQYIFLIPVVSRGPFGASALHFSFLFDHTLRQRRNFIHEQTNS